MRKVKVLWRPSTDQKNAESSSFHSERSELLSWFFPWRLVGVELLRNLAWRLSALGLPSRTWERDSNKRAFAFRRLSISSFCECNFFSILSFSSFSSEDFADSTFFLSDSIRLFFVVISLHNDSIVASLASRTLFISACSLRKSASRRRSFEIISFISRS